MLDLFKVQRWADSPFHEFEIKINRLIRQPVTMESVASNVEVSRYNLPGGIHVLGEIDHPARELASWITFPACDLRRLHRGFL